MVCQKCGALVDDSLNVCDNCGYIFEEATASAETDGSEYNINPNAPALPDAFKPERKKIKLKLGFVFLLSVLAAVAVVVLTFYGTHYMTLAGTALNKMQSSGAGSLFGFGTGIDSSYYVYMGAAIYGLSYVFKGLGVAFASMIVLLGIKKSYTDEDNMQ